MANGRNEKAAFDALTPRQREVVRLVAEGLSTKEIGAHLKISKRTAEFHRRQLTARLGHPLHRWPDAVRHPGRSDQAVKRPILSRRRR